MKKYLFLVLFICVSLIAWASSQQEISPSRGKYLAQRGRIVPPEEIIETSYISAVDYHYPDPENPEDAIGVRLYSGNRQLSTGGQEEVILIGVQGNRQSLKETMPLNIAFVIDRSGSMSAQNKMDWVKDSFEIFIKTVNDNDYVSLIVFDDKARVLFPSTQMGVSGARHKFRHAVQSITTGGGTDIFAGLKLGYKQLEEHYKKGYVNRVLLLTDGLSDCQGIYAMARKYKQRMGITVSTIGLGQDFDADLMRELAKEGGGSSRFVADRETMEEVFGTGLGRMVVSVARDITLELKLLQNIKVRNTWGYNHQVEGQTVHYFLPNVYLNDYETIVVQCQVPHQKVPGVKTIARLRGSYTDSKGRENKVGPIELSTQFVPQINPVDGYSNATVLKAATMLHYAQGLKKIGTLYNEAQKYKDSTEKYAGTLHNLIDMTNTIKKELLNARQRLDYVGFDDELPLLEAYLSILGNELKLEDQEITWLLRDEELRPSTEKRDMNDCFNNLFQELRLNLQETKPGNIAVSRFSFTDGRPAPILDMLDKKAESALSELSQFTLLKKERIDRVLKEQKLTISHLMDTNQAIQVGEYLSVDYVLTGTVIEMKNSVVVFSRIVNISNSSIESVSQVILPRDKELDSLIGFSHNVLDLVERGQNVELKMALDSGADANAINAEGQTALMLAVLYDHEEIVETLLASGVEIDAVDNEGFTALMKAVKYGNIPITQILIDRGAELDLKDKGGMTALMWAAEYEQVSCSKLLIKAGADITVKDHRGWTAFMKAVAPYWSEHAKVEIVKSLLDAGGNINERNPDGFTPLMTAAVSGQPEIVSTLLEAGADVLAQDNQGNTALMWAEKEGNTEIIELLKEVGAKE
jgi:hypothetical protein